MVKSIQILWNLLIYLKMKRNRNTYLKQTSETCIKDRIKFLKNVIGYYDQLYYNSTVDSITDRNYDRLRLELKTYQQYYPQFFENEVDKIGCDPIKELPKITHKRKMYSIDSSYDLTEIKKFVESITVLETGGFVIEHKIDGLAASLIYENGCLKQGATRGNGTEGNDITDKVALLDSIPKRISLSGTVEVRGELYIPKDRGNTTTGLLRSQAVGSVLSKNPNDVIEKGLFFSAYDLFCYDSDIPETEEECLVLLKECGFCIVGYTGPVRRWEEIEACINNLESQRHAWKYEADGLVLKVNNKPAQEELGYTLKYPKWSFAYKFCGESNVTTVKALKWNMGKTGQLTPLIEVEPVKVGKAVIQNINAKNLKELKKLNVGFQDKVEIIYEGSVYPKIKRIIERKDTIRFNSIEKCPFCGFAVGTQTGNAVCMNSVCPEVVKIQIQHFFSKNALHVRYLDSNLIELAISGRSVKNGLDIIMLTVEDWVDLGIKRNKAISLVNELRRTFMGCSKENLIIAMNIKGIGPKFASKLASKINTIEDIFSLTVYDFINYFKVSKSVALKLRNELTTNRSMSLLSSLKKLKIFLENS